MKKFLLTLLLYGFTLPVLAQTTLLVVGDSISAGRGINPNQGWVALLQERLKAQKYPYDVINASISGDTLSNGLQRLPTALAQYQPKITIIELGGNDGLRALPLFIIKKNLDTLIDLALAAKSEVLVVGLRLPPNYGEAYTTQFQQIFQDLKKRTDIHVVPLFLQGVDDKSQLMQADGIHPNAEAQSILLDNIWGELQLMLR